MPQITEMLDAPPEWLQDWGKQTGAKLEDGLRESPSWIAFARENGTVYHTYTVSAPDPFVAPYYSFLLERTPKATDESEPRAWRKDEYPESIGARRVGSKPVVWQRLSGLPWCGAGTNPPVCPFRPRPPTDTLGALGATVMDLETV